MMFYFINYNYDCNILFKVLFGNKTFNFFSKLSKIGKLKFFNMLE